MATAKKKQRPERVEKARARLRGKELQSVLKSLAEGNRITREQLSSLWATFRAVHGFPGLMPPDFLETKADYNALDDDEVRSIAQSMVVPPRSKAVSVLGINIRVLMNWVLNVRDWHLQD